MYFPGLLFTPAAAETVPKKVVNGNLKKTGRFLFAPLRQTFKILFHCVFDIRRSPLNVAYVYFNIFFVDYDLFNFLWLLNCCLPFFIMLNGVCYPPFCELYCYSI